MNKSLCLIAAALVLGGAASAAPSPAPAPIEKLVALDDMPRLVGHLTVSGDGSRIYIPDGGAYAVLDADGKLLDHYPADSMPARKLVPLDPNELRARARNQIRRKFYQDRLRADLGHALELALTDPLTGFYNQRYLMRHLHGLLDTGTDRIAVMMLDLDHFKEINDRWGHPVGDQALRAVAETLRARVRVFDSIARYGGEEFVVVMPGATVQEAEGAAERLRSAIEQIRFEPEPGVVHRMTVSIGVACSRPGRTPEQVLQMADAALYAAKDAGRNCMKMAAAD